MCEGGYKSANINDSFEEENNNNTYNNNDNCDYFELDKISNDSNIYKGLKKQKNASFGIKISKGSY